MAPQIPQKYSSTTPTFAMRSVIVVLSLALAAFGQGAAIGAPTAGQTLVAGENTTVIVERPVSILALLSFALPHLTLRFLFCRIR